MIKAGELNQRIDIESFSTVRDANTGNVSSAWSSYLTVWASVKEAGGEESDEEGVFTGETVAEVICRKDTSNPISQRMRVKHHGYYWDILAVNEYGFNEGYKLKIRKRDNDASS